MEFVLVDGGLIQSKSVAIQIGDETRASMSTLVFQNITIQQSHRRACPASQPHITAVHVQEDRLCLLGNAVLAWALSDACW